MSTSLISLAFAAEKAAGLKSHGIAYGDDNSALVTFPFSQATAQKHAAAISHLIAALLANQISFSVTHLHLPTGERFAAIEIPNGFHI